MANKSQIKKVCRRCSVEKSISDFGPAQNTADKIQVWCKDCRRQYALNRYRANKPAMDAKRMELHWEKQAKKASFKQVADEMDNPSELPLE